MNPQELYIDAASGRFLDGESSIPIAKPNIFSNEEKTLKINVLNIKRNVVSKLIPSKNSKLKARIGTATAKLAEQSDAITTPTLITAIGSVTTIPASAATGLGTADIFSPVTATVKASITSLPAVTANVIANVVYVSPITASITCGIITQITFPSAEIFSVPIQDDLALNNDIISNYTNSKSTSGQPGILTRVLDFTAVSLSDVAQASFTVTTSGTGVGAINISSRGKGYPNGNYYLTFSGGSPTTTASAIATCENGVVTTISIVEAGNYASAPSVSLFSPAKGIKRILPTGLVNERIVTTGSNAGQSIIFFRWVRGLTTVTQDKIPLIFSEPDVSSAVTPTRTPVAYLEFVPESILKTSSTVTTAAQQMQSSSGVAELNNLWKIVIEDPGYGYSSAPTVSHGPAIVSSYVYGCKPILIEEGLYYGGASVTAGGPSQPYEIWFAGENFYESPSRIGFKGCAVLANLNLLPNFYAFPDAGNNPAEYLIGSSYNKSYKATANYYPSPWLNDDGSLVYRELCPISPMPVGYFPYAKPTNNIVRLNNFAVRYPNRDKTSGGYKAIFQTYICNRPEEGISKNSKLAKFLIGTKDNIDDLSYPAGTFSASFATSNENIKHNLINISTSLADDRFSAVFNVLDFSDPKGIFYTNAGGGIAFSDWQVLDYGENYNYTVGGFAKDTQFIATTEVLSGSVLQETFFNVSSATIPNTITNGFLPSNIARQTVVATRPGAKFTETFVEIGGNMVYRNPVANSTQIVVSFSGTVNTASILNSPAPYSDGSYALTVQAPTAGTTAKMNLVINRGISSVVVLDGGSGYTSAPIVTAPSPNARNGFISSAQITNIPFGYSEGKSYSLEVGASPTTGGTAALSLVKSGDLYSVNIKSSGFGYTQNPTVTAPGPEKQNIGNVTNLVLQENPVGYLPNTNLPLQIQPSPDPQGQAEGFIQVDSSGVARVIIGNSGFGYTSAPIVTAPGPNKISGKIVGATITNFGKGFPIGTYPCIVTTAPNGGETARISLVVENLVSRSLMPQSPKISFRIDSPGFGYATNPIITATTPPGNAIGGITITCQGSFYENETANFEISDPTGTNAVFGSVVVSQGKISLIPFVYGGGNYSDTPKITFGNPELPESEVIPANQVFGKFDITTASANAILTTSNSKDVILEVYETDGTNEQVVVQGTMNLAKRVLE